MNDRYYLIYKITLLQGPLSNHYYYCKHTTSNPSYDGYAGSGKTIREYFQQYGRKQNVTYTKQIVGFCDNQEDLNRSERDIIGDRYKNDPLCLNTRAGGVRYTHTEETKARISASNKGKHLSEETKAKISAAHKGKHFSESARQKMSLSHMGMKRSEETRAKMSAAHKGKNHYMYGRHHTEETKKKISASKKGKPCSSKTKLLIESSHYGELQIASTKAKISNTMKNKHWIHLHLPLENKTLTKRVDTEYLDYWLDDGWSLGKGPRNNKNTKNTKRSNKSKHTGSPSTKLPVSSAGYIKHADGDKPKHNTKERCFIRHRL